MGVGRLALRRIKAQLHAGHGRLMLAANICCELPFLATYRYFHAITPRKLPRRFTYARAGCSGAIEATREAIKDVDVRSVRPSLVWLNAVRSRYSNWPLGTKTIKSVIVQAELTIEQRMELRAQLLGPFSNTFRLDN